MVLGGGLLFVLAVVIAIGAQYYRGGAAAPAASADPAAAAPAGAETITVTAFVGGEKMPFLKDPRVTSILKDRYGITVDATKSGSVDMVQSAMPGKDALWPSTSTAVDIFKEHGGTWVARENIFSSPLVFDSYDTIVVALEKAGMVSDRTGVKYLDLPKLVGAMKAGKTWKDLGMTSATKIKIFSTDPTKSNSGLMFAGLYASVLNNNEPPDDTTIEALLPEIKEYFARLGNMDASSSDLFAKFLSMGAGAYPMVAAYENQLVEFVDTNPQFADQIKAHVVVLYPEPTMWSEHPILALNPKGKKLLDALHDDEELKKIAAQAHGFRSALSGVTGNLAAVDSTVPMPSEAVTGKILATLTTP